MNQPTQLHHRHIVRMRQLPMTIGVSRSTIYTWLDQNSPHHDPSFPRPLRLGVKSVGWDSSALDAWISSRDTAISSSCNVGGHSK